MAMRWSSAVSISGAAARRPAGAMHGQPIRAHLDFDAAGDEAVGNHFQPVAFLDAQFAEIGQLRDVPTAQAAAMARMGISSIMLGTRPDAGTATPRRAKCRRTPPDRRPARRPASAGLAVGDVGAHFFQRRHTRRCGVD